MGIKKIKLKCTKRNASINIENNILRIAGIDIALSAIEFIIYEVNAKPYKKEKILLEDLVRMPLDKVLKGRIKFLLPNMTIIVNKVHNIIDVYNNISNFYNESEMYLFYGKKSRLYVKHMLYKSV